MRKECYKGCIYFAFVQKYYLNVLPAWPTLFNHFLSGITVHFVHSSKAGKSVTLADKSSPVVSFSDDLYYMIATRMVSLSTLPECSKLTSLLNYYILSHCTQ